MKRNSNIIIAAMALLLNTTATAQTPETAYFTEGYLYGHVMNPAKGNDQGYVAFPALSNLTIEAQGNIHLDNFLFKRNNRTVLFTHPDVSTAQFLKNLDKKCTLKTDVNEQILGLAFKSFGGYNTMSVSLRSNAAMSIDGTLFRMAKEGLSNTTYNVSNTRLHADAYTEVAVGHSHDINDMVRVGAKVKLLVGMGYAEARLNKASFAVGEDNIEAVTNAQVEASLKDFAFKTEQKMRGPEGQQTLHQYVSGADMGKAGIAGTGLAFDLGVEVKPMKDLTVSAALVDLGKISYTNNVVASTGGERAFSTDRYYFNANDESDHSFSNEADRLVEDLAALYELQDMGDQGSVSRKLAATFNMGAEYKMPFYDKLTAGLLITKRFGYFGWTTTRLSANVAPVKIFSASASIAAGSHGAALGWTLNFHPKGLNIFLAMDRTFGKLTKQYIPVSANGSLSMGLNFTF